MSRSEIDYTMIRPEMIASLKRYVENRIEPGGFLRAVLENNLMESFGRADEQNREVLFHICCYVYNELPFNCHGSRDTVKYWLGEIPKEIVNDTR